MDGETWDLWTTREDCEKEGIEMERECRFDEGIPDECKIPCSGDTEETRRRDETKCKYL